LLFSMCKSIRVALNIVVKLQFFYVNIFCLVISLPDRYADTCNGIH